MQNNLIPEALHRKDIYRLGNLSITFNISDEPQVIHEQVLKWGQWIAPDSQAHDWRIIGPIREQGGEAVIGAVLNQDDSRQVRLFIEKGILVEVLWNSPVAPLCPE